MRQCAEGIRMFTSVCITPLDVMAVSVCGMRACGVGGRLGVLYERSSRRPQVCVYVCVCVRACVCVCVFSHLTNW